MKSYLNGVCYVKSQGQNQQAQSSHTHGEIVSFLFRELIALGYEVEIEYPVYSVNGGRWFSDLAIIHKTSKLPKLFIEVVNNNSSASEALVRETAWGSMIVGYMGGAKALIQSLQTTYGRQQLSKQMIKHQNKVRFAA